MHNRDRCNYVQQMAQHFLCQSMVRSRFVSPALTRLRFNSYKFQGTLYNHFPASSSSSPTHSRRRLSFIDFILGVEAVNPPCSMLSLSGVSYEYISIPASKQCLGTEPLRLPLVYVLKVQITHSLRANAKSIDSLNAHRVSS